MLFLFLSLAFPSRCALQATSDIDVKPSAWTTGVRVSLHQTLRVPPPADYAEWRVQADPKLLKLRTPPDAARRPGTGGWRFAAVGRGETVIKFIPFVPDSPDDPMQPVFRLKVTIE